jgi:predicted phosphodiesterase
MRYAILADIHSNLEALKSVIKDIGSQSVDRIFCAGDIVGYGPHPDECVRSIKDMGAVSVLGNHDAVVVGKANISRFNDNARGAAVWTKKNHT